MWPCEGCAHDTDTGGVAKGWVRLETGEGRGLQRCDVAQYGQGAGGAEGGVIRAQGSVRGTEGKVLRAQGRVRGAEGRVRGG